MEYMLTWTLGGYPSPMLSLVGESQQEDFDVERWYRDEYGKDAKTVRGAVDCFCRAFRLYPYSGGALYCGPKNLGMANLWSLKPDGKPSTMVGYSFDDYESWIGPYSVESYMDSMAEMLRLWKEGLDQLGELKTAQAKELRLFAQVVYLQYEADLLHTRYAVLKRDLPSNKEELEEVLEEAEENTRLMLKRIGKHPVIAYEASNSYFFTSRNLLEKLAQLSQLRRE